MTQDYDDGDTTDSHIPTKQLKWNTEPKYLTNLTKQEHRTYFQIQGIRTMMDMQQMNMKIIKYLQSSSKRQQMTG